MPRKKDDRTSGARLLGLDACDAMVKDLCSRGLLAITPEVLGRLSEYERSLQSYKLRRFAAEMAALRQRLSSPAAADAAMLIDRLARLRQASSRLRSLLKDSASDPLEIEDLAGHTWREGDLDRRENALLVEMAWETGQIEEGFRVDASYFLAGGGNVLCELKIIPLGLHVPMDYSLKPRRPGPKIYPAIGIYPGDLPRRVKILGGAGDGGGLVAPDMMGMARELLRGHPEDVGAVLRQFTERMRRPFPPVTVPFVLARPRLRWSAGKWWVIGRDCESLRVAGIPGIEREPSAGSILASFESCALSGPMDAIMALLFDTGQDIAAAPVGAIMPERVVRFGIDVV